MDPMGYKMKWPTSLCKVRQNPSSLCFCWWICRPWLVFGGLWQNVGGFAWRTNHWNILKSCIMDFYHIEIYWNILKSYLRAIFMDFSHGCGSKTLDTPRKGGYLKKNIPIWNIPLKWYQIHPCSSLTPMVSGGVEKNGERDCWCFFIHNPIILWTRKISLVLIQ